MSAFHTHVTINAGYPVEKQAPTARVVENRKGVVCYPFGKNYHVTGCGEDWLGQRVLSSVGQVEVRSRIHVCLVLTIAAPDHSLSMQGKRLYEQRRMLRCCLTEPTITANGPLSIVVMSLRITVAFVLKHANLL
eukprot:COSAG02_NODE_8354_length_2600_cov_1.864454_1_plen_133_part_10